MTVDLTQTLPGFGYTWEDIWDTDWLTRLAKQKGLDKWWAEHAKARLKEIKEKTSKKEEPEAWPY